ncbi:hypothetical protein FKM82_017280 [Ascaphus truei]
MTLMWSNKVRATDKVDLLSKSKIRSLNRGHDMNKNYQSSASSGVKFITKLSGYSNQITEVLNRNWSILMCDPHLKKHLTPREPVIFCKASNIKNQLALSRLKGSGPCHGSGNCPH